MDDSFLSVTGVIATILSLIFASAAIWNSHVRRKHLESMYAAKNPAPASKAPKFVMPTDALPAAPANKAPPPPPSPPPPQPSPPQALFRKIIPDGAHVDADDSSKKDNLYVWE